jgi:hypothetical protein
LFALVGANFSPNSAAPPCRCETPRPPENPRCRRPRVAEQRRGDEIFGGILRTERADGFDGVGVGFFEVVNGGVEQQRDVFFVDDLFQHHGVEDERVALGIARHVSRPELVNHAALARPAVVVPHVRGRAENPQAHLAGGIAAQHRAILNQSHLESRPRRRDGAHTPAKPPPMTARSQGSSRFSR